jgi:hypothetical protein
MKKIEFVQSSGGYRCARRKQRRFDQLFDEHQADMLGRDDPAYKAMALEL